MLEVAVHMQSDIPGSLGATCAAGFPSVTHKAVCAVWNDADHYRSERCTLEQLRFQLCLAHCLQLLASQNAVSTTHRIWRDGSLQYVAVSKLCCVALDALQPTVTG